MKKWKVGVALVCTSVLLGFAANQKVEAAIHSYGTINNVNQKEGTYDVTIHATTDEMGIDGIREVKVPIWSTPNQSDLVWYKANHQGNGIWKVRMNTKNHQFHRGNYTTHIYLYSKNGQVEGINAGQTKLNNVLSAEIKNVNAKTGTYDVVVKDHIGGEVDSVSVPIWSKPDQSDLVWYKAKKQSDGTWIVHMNINNHKYHTGNYTTHVYMYTKNQGVHAISLGQTNVQSESEQLMAQIQNVNPKAGTYDVVVQAKSGAGIKQVSVPIWSKANQSDLVWYPAQKRADGSYIVHMSIKNHKYNIGNYTTHVYAWKNNGSEMAISLGQTNIIGTPDELKADVSNVNQKEGTYDVSIHAYAQGGIREVYVPTWSAPDQSDIVCYKAQKQADGSYKLRMNVRNHKNHRGTYISHVYAYSNRGTVKAISAGETKLNNVLSAEIKNVNAKTGTYDVVVKDHIGGEVDSVSVPIWSKPDQSDIVWYKASKQADGTYVAHMNIKNHKYHTGNYTTHVYMYTKNQGVHAISLGQTNIQGIKDQLSAEIKNVNQKNGTYDVVINASSQFGVKEISVPIWSTRNQSDLVWYKAQEQADGSYVVHMNIKNHQSHRGTYMTHVYMYNNRGQQTAIPLNNTNLPAIPDTLKAQIKNVDKESGSYDVVIQAASQQGIERVEVPTWSTANQSDLVWYPAQKQADGSYIVHVNIKNHKNNRGNYTSHVYLWHPDGSNTAINIGQTDLTKPIQEQPKPTEQPEKTDNQQSGNTNTGNTTEPTKPTEQPGKTEEPQDRELNVEKIKTEVIALVNKERQANNLNTLTIDTDLQVTADIRSKEIQIDFSHVRPDGTMYDTAFDKDDREISENAIQNWHIADLDEEKIAIDLFNSWKNSSGHYKNMMINRWTRTAIGISFNSTKQGIYGVQIFSNDPLNLERDEDGTVIIPMN